MKEQVKPTIIIIPAEGDSAETEIWYIKSLKRHYKIARRKQPEILVFEHDNSDAAMKLGVAVSTQLKVYEFIREHSFEIAEIHAQGGLGAFVACEFLRYYAMQDDPEYFGRRIALSNVFLIGGAPSEAMTPIARWFHRSFVKFWYYIRWAVPFFADDPPNPECDEEITKIRVSSTRVMQANPKLYRDQLLCIGEWRIANGWQVPDGVNVWYVPNGETLRPKLWDNTYDDAKARACWQEHGVQVTARPGRHFSFYSMMPAYALFEVMAKVL